MPRLRHVATVFAADHCERETEMAVALAVTEACTNVVRHAYRNGRGDITLNARLDGADIVFEIIDQGTGMTEPSGAAGLGVGLEIMRRVANARIASDGTGTRVELRFPRRSAST